MAVHRPSPVRRIARPCQPPLLTSGGGQDLSRLYEPGTCANPNHTLNLVYAAPATWDCLTCHTRNDPWDTSCLLCLRPRLSRRPRR